MPERADCRLAFVANLHGIVNTDDFHSHRGAKQAHQDKRCARNNGNLHSAPAGELGQPGFKRCTFVRGRLRRGGCIVAHCRIVYGEPMCSPIQFKHRRAVRPRVASGKLALLLLSLFILRGGMAEAQQTPATPVGRVEGNDISVQGEATPGNDNETITPSMYVGNGSVVTVHSGQARMTLFGGGEVDICGPAKFTLLQSGGAITLALDFGRMRVRIPSATPLRIFTPTIVATPIDIGGAERDVTVGLNLDDSLCVLAESGAMQLEHQFSGERMIVPQTGEFFLNGGKLVPVVGKPGTCQCAALRMPAIPAGEKPEYALAPPPAAEPPQPQPEAPAINREPAGQPDLEFSVPAHANEAHPVLPAEKNPAPAVPPASAPVYTIVAPPLTFSASSPQPPPEPPIDTFLLVREARVEPEWEFRGHVDPPNFAEAMQRALGEGEATSLPSLEPQKRHGGFWRSLRRFFIGGDS